MTYIPAKYTKRFISKWTIIYNRPPAKYSGSIKVQQNVGGHHWDCRTKGSVRGHRSLLEIPKKRIFEILDRDQRLKPKIK